MIMVTFVPKLQICALAQLVSIVTLLYQYCCSVVHIMFSCMSTTVCLVIIKLHYF